ncbi:MAG: MBOAT family protein [Clostridia bacterium]|nr:MBOAT family protein [Clostridia bacterium]
MSINSLNFILFVAIVCIMYFLFPKKVKWVILLFASYVFYFLASSKLIVFLLATTISIYLAALLIGKIEKNTKKICKEIEDKAKKKEIKNKAKTKKKWVIVATLLINFGFLAFLKYFNFIAGNLNSLFELFHFSIEIPFKDLILPLGISYYTLQAVSYAIDVYRGKIEPDKNLGRVALFVSFFPQIVEGPIGRYESLANQLYEPHKFNYRNAKFGIQLMIWGYFKKMVIADRAGLFVNAVFGSYSEYSGVAIFLAIALYTLQIYAEFSGCMDIVRGTAQIMGIDMAVNFERPFFSRSVQEFWRRWHITLGTWLKDYIFYPISFSKFTLKLTEKAKKLFKNSYIAKLIPAAFALFFVWFGNGIWHGASWKYICYGLYYYIIMLLGMLLEPLGNKIVQLLKVNTKAFSYKLWQILRTTGFVFIGMLIFRSHSLQDAFSMFTSMFSLKSIGSLVDGSLLKIGGLVPQDFTVLIIGVVMLFVVGLLQEKGYKIREKIEEQNLPFRWLLYYGIIFAIIILGIYGPGYVASDFIYGQF